ncbi:MAG TPA: hypothetical protein VFK05_02270 [Polyangiaceae bacterium]|nr:hypothetical protein [Polyangiaceae bacterium]
MPPHRSWISTRAATVALLLPLAACDPIRVVSGEVRSVPPPGNEAARGDVRPLAGTIVKATCGVRPGMALPDPQAGTGVLAISRSDGTFDYGEIGTWDKDCVLDFESGDGSHDSRRLAISDLCRRYTGDEHCLRLEGLTVDLVRRREPAPPVEVRVRTTPAALEFHTDDAFTCRAPCEVQLSRGLHRFQLFEPQTHRNVWREQATVTADTELTVRYESHLDRQLVASWFFLPLTVGAVMLPIGLVNKNSTLSWTGAGLAVGGGVGFLLVWKSDRVEVNVRPVLPVAR